MAAHNIRCLVFEDDMQRIGGWVPDVELSPVEDATTAELAVVFGGDGTMLRAAAWAHPRLVPLLGVNLGHVGFLAELEPSDIDQLIEQVLHQTYEVERRFTLGLRVSDAAGEPIWESFAVNEVSLEKLARERLLQVSVIIDSRPLSVWSCDGVLVSTPTGSTAYAFSAGGPVVWPDVQGFLVVPLSAHALFSRPLVLGPDSTVELQIEHSEGPGGVLWCDGRRSKDIPVGGRARIVRGEHPLLIARLSEQPFTSRLVRKFGLPVKGWRSAPEHT